METIIDNGLLKLFDNAVEDYVNDDVKITTYKSAIMALLNGYSSRMHDINLLIKSHRLDSAKILTRTAFENNVYLQYIFERPNRVEDRGNAYFYSDFQKFAFYLTFIDQAPSFSKAEIINGLNNSNNPETLGHCKNINEYLNYKREKFSNCFNYLGKCTKGLTFEILHENDDFKPCKIDHWKWYNSDGHTNNFRDLITKLNLLDQYTALYLPTSDSVHSDGLNHNIKYEPQQITVVESFDPTLLTFFKGNIIRYIKMLGKYIHNPRLKHDVSVLHQKARLIYIANHH